MDSPPPMTKCPQSRIAARFARPSASHHPISFINTTASSRSCAAAVRAEDVTAAAAQDLDEAVVLMKEIGWWLALGLANLAAILDCGHFVIGGGLSIASELVLPSAREYLVDLVEGYRARPAITVTPSMFGPRSGAMGAALVAFERTS